MNRARIALIAVAASFAGLAALPSGASAIYMEENDSFHSSDTSVEATLSFDKRSDFEYRDVRLRIVRNGATVLDGPVTEPCEDCGVAPAGRGEDDSMRVVDLNADREPEVLIELYTGGAHCCTIALVYGYDALTGNVDRDWFLFLDAGYRLVDINRDGRPEFKSLDARFSFVFAPYAGSVFPLRVVNWDAAAGFADTTREFRRQLMAHARKLRARYESMRGRRGGDVRPVLAAYVAEKYLLGQGPEGYAVAVRAYRRGELGGFGRGDTYPKGRKYLRTLRRVLDRFGYR